MEPKTSTKAAKIFEFILLSYFNKMFNKIKSLRLIASTRPSSPAERFPRYSSTERTRDGANIAGLGHSTTNLRELVEPMFEFYFN